MRKIKLMTHIVAGYPSMKECEEIALCMDKSGVSFIEIQIPFSDPIADGPTIMGANEKALLNGTTPNDCFELIKRLKKTVKAHILIMSYFNILFNYGLEQFCRKAKELGIYGLIIPDIPMDEEKHDHYIEICKKHSLHSIQVISPITTVERLKKLRKVASGFVYCISTLGTTGERKELNPKLKDYLKKVRKIISLPLALGFGISSKDQAMEAAKSADIVVIGSKMINLYKKGKVKAVKDFLRKMLRPQ